MFPTLEPVDKSKFLLIIPSLDAARAAWPHQNWPHRGTIRSSRKIPAHASSLIRSTDSRRAAGSCLRSLAHYGNVRSAACRGIRLAKHLHGHGGCTSQGCQGHPCALAAWTEITSLSVTSYSRSRICLPDPVQGIGRALLASYRQDSAGLHAVLLSRCGSRAASALRYFSCAPWHRLSRISRVCRRPSGLPCTSQVASICLPASFADYCWLVYFEASFFILVVIRTGTRNLRDLLSPRDSSAKLTWGAYATSSSLLASHRSLVPVVPGPRESVVCQRQPKWYHILYRVWA